MKRPVNPSPHLPLSPSFGMPAAFRLIAQSAAAALIAQSVGADHAFAAASDPLAFSDLLPVPVSLETENPVDRAYQIVLGRAATPADRDFWRAKLILGQATAAGVESYLRGGEEAYHLTHKQLSCVRSMLDQNGQVQAARPQHDQELYAVHAASPALIERIYRETLGRAPSAIEIHAADGLPVVSLEARLRQSSEYASRQGLAGEAAVNLVESILKRTPNAGPAGGATGAAIGYLNTGNLPALTNGMLLSPEFLGAHPAVTVNQVNSLFSCAGCYHTTDTPVSAPPAESPSPIDFVSPQPVIDLKGKVLLGVKLYPDLVYDRSISFPDAPGDPQGSPQAVPAGSYNPLTGAARDEALAAVATRAVRTAIPGHAACASTYAKDGTPMSALKLDLYLPADAGPDTPLVVFVHGGAYTINTRKNPAITDIFFPLLSEDPGFPAYLQSHPVADRNGARLKQDRAFAVASITYRLGFIGNYTTQPDWQHSYQYTQNSPEYLGNPDANHNVPCELVPKAAYPAAVQDVRTAIQWLRKHAGRHYSASRIGIFGDSAGGHLASVVGNSRGIPQFRGRGDPAISGDVQAVVNYFGLATVQSLARPPVRGVTYPDLTSPADTELFTLSNPANIINYAAVSPPFLIVHGTADQTVDICHSDDLSGQLYAAGVYVKYLQIPGTGHESTTNAAMKLGDNAFAVRQHFLQFLAP